jgi:hypothetical protein
MALLDDLIQGYAASDLKSIFESVGLDSTKVNPIHLPTIKEVTLAQWLLESGRATSKLANEAKNFAGLKWRPPEMNDFATSILIKVPSEPNAVEFCEFENINKFISGYWKFFTRSPYKGIEENLFSPSAFLGFIHRAGFAADPRYVGKVLSLLLESQELLAKASGATLVSIPQKLQVTRFPQEVEVKRTFQVEGIASQSDAGKLLAINVDSRFPSTGTIISADGHWHFDFVFLSSGDRQMAISAGSETVEIKIKAITAVDAADNDETLTPSASDSDNKLELSGSVGVGGLNKKVDVKAVKSRLHKLGYTWVGNPDTETRDRGLDDAIRLFQSIIQGASNVVGDGRVDVSGITHRWLQAKNAPRWQIMPDSNPTIGFVNFEREDTSDNHDFGTKWLHDAILSIAKDFQTSFRASNPSAAPFAINNVSLPHGGDTHIHAGHETGLMCDVLLPKGNGGFGGTTWRLAEYDQTATRALIKSIRKNKLVRSILFNDPDLIDEGLCSFASGHDNHIHFEIDPPVRE